MDSKSSSPPTRSSGWPIALLAAVSESPYFGIYDRWKTPWQMAAGEVDGEPAVLIMYRGADGWRPESAARLTTADGRIVLIGDYLHCPWILRTAQSVVIAPA